MELCRLEGPGSSRTPAPGEGVVSGVGVAPGWGRVGVAPAGAWWAWYRVGRVVGWAWHQWGVLSGGRGVGWAWATLHRGYPLEHGSQAAFRPAHGRLEGVWL